MTDMQEVVEKTKQSYTPVVFQTCKLCGSPEVVRLPIDWQDNADSKRIAIVGCGNPFHYVFPTNE